MAPLKETVLLELSLIVVPPVQIMLVLFGELLLSLIVTVTFLVSDIAPVLSFAYTANVTDFVAVTFETDTEMISPSVIPVVLPKVSSGGMDVISYVICCPSGSLAPLKIT